MESYRITLVSRVYILLAGIFPVMLVLALDLFVFAFRPELRQPLLLPIVIGHLIAAWNVYAWLRLPLRIIVSDAGLVSFHSPIQHRELRPVDIISISARTMSIVKIKHTKGTITLVHNVDGFYRLVGFLKRENPEIVTYGV